MPSDGPLFDTVYVVSHTHWDREWYQAFQGFRVRLVYMLDELIAIMEGDPEYRHFNLDGQTILLDDYVEIRPENSERLRALIEAGRIRVGPWYVMPDEFLVSGESLIRNLALGMRIARQWGGEALRCGYIPDAFGHNSQLPQILRGFGIDSVVFFRGLGDCPTAEIWWDGADGSRVLGLKLSEDRSYSDWFFAARWPFADRQFVYQPAEFIDRVKVFLAYKRRRATTAITVAFDGVDHGEVEPRLPWMLKTLNASDLGVNFVHADLAQYLDALKAQVGDLRVYSGEQRVPGNQGVSNNVLANTLSTRVHLKQMNQHCETLLLHWAEPWGVFTMLEGRPYPQGFLAKAWEYLLQNHAHDSICGTGTDQVDRDMVGRFDQSRLVSEAMIQEELKFITHHIDTQGAPGQFLVTVFNPSQEAVDGVLAIDLTLPAGTDAAVKFPLYGGTSFKIYGATGREVPYQVLAVDRNQVQLHRWYRDIPATQAVDRFHLVLAGVVPAFGYASYLVEPLPMEGPQPGEYRAQRMSTPVRYPGSQRIAEHTWDNGRITLHVEPNGTIRITDHDTGHSYGGLLEFEDEADMGDAWTHAHPVSNAEVSSWGARAEISVLNDGPLATRLRMQTALRVPEAIAPGHTARSAALTTLTVTTEVELRQDDPLLRCRTVIHNTARDHRLRVLFPTGLTTESFFTSTPFDLVERAVDLPDYSQYLENFSGVVPHSGLIVLHDGRAGLAIYSRGLYEAAVRNHDGHTIALTLFRSIGQVVAANDTDGGQLLGDLDFSYAIRPFAVDGDPAGRLWKEHQQFVGGLRVIQRAVDAVHFDAPHRRMRDLPLSKSFLTVEAADVIVSAIKGADERPDRGVIRLFNPRAVPSQGVIRFDRPLAAAKLLDLQETVVAGAEWHDREVRVALGPKQLVTLAVEWA